MIRPARATGYLAALLVFDVICLQLAVQVAMQLRYLLPFGRTVLPEWAAQLFYAPTVWLHATVFVVWAASLILASLYTPRRVAFWGDEVQRLLLGHTAAALILAGILYLAKAELPRLTFVYFYLLSLALMVLARVGFRLYYALRRRPALQTMRLLVAGQGVPALTIVQQLRTLDWPGLELVGMVEAGSSTIPVADLPVVGTLATLEDAIAEQQADAVLIALPREAHELLPGIVTRLNRLPVRLYIVPDYSDLAFFDATIERLGSIPLIGLRDPAIDGLQRILKRVMDILVSAGGLAVLSPLLAVAALAIKLGDGGPVIYRTTRVGENGRVFSMLKFRTMVPNAEALQEQVNQTDEAGNFAHKSASDPRVTRVGRILRRMSIDELPQLLNVLRGEMSLVGPRPELPWLMDRYAPWQHKRFAVPQGMTGWWQVNSRSDNPLLYLHSEEDLYYVQNYSLWLDIQILWKTLSVVLRGKGAY